MLTWLSVGLAIVLQSAPVSKDVAREADDNRVICKSEAKTGTRQKTRICMTRAQWDDIREQNQRDLKEMSDRPVICGGGGSAEGC